MRSSAIHTTVSVIERHALTRSCPGRAAGCWIGICSSWNLKEKQNETDCGALEVELQLSGLYAWS